MSRSFIFCGYGFIKMVGFQKVLTGISGYCKAGRDGQLNPVQDFTQIGRLPSNRQDLFLPDFFQRQDQRCGVFFS